jgi:hypothetical protein
MTNLSVGDSVTIKSGFQFNQGFFIKETEPGIVMSNESDESVVVIFREISECFANAKILISSESLEVN